MHKHSARPGLLSLTAALFAACLCLILAGAATAQQRATLRGVVADSARGTPLHGASVLVRSAAGQTLGAATDADGYFSIPRIPAGDYLVRISYIGYVTIETELALAQGELRFERYVLAEDSRSIEEIIVEGERETGVATVRGGLQTIVPADIARVPVPGVSGDVAAYLQTLPGVVVQGDRGGQLFLRGGALDQSLTMIDGLPLYVPFHVLSFYSAVPEDIVDRVDLYSAGFGASYGTRVSSVMDVHTRNGNKRNVAGSVSLAPFLSGALVEAPLVRNRVSVVGSARRSLVRELMPNLLGQRFPYRFGDAFAKLHAVAGRGHTLSATGLASFDRGDIAGSRKTFEGDVLAEAETDSNEVSWSNSVFGGTYRYVASTVPLSVSITGGSSTTTNGVGPTGDEDRESEVQSVDVAGRIDYSMRIGEVSAGSRYRRSRLSHRVDGQFQDLTEGTARVHEWVTFAEASLGARGVSVEPSLQLYSVRGFKARVDPRLRLGWSGRVLVPASVSFAAGRYHQAIVGLNDERDIGSIFTVWVPAAAALPSAIHLVAGLSVSPTSWLSVSAEAFTKEFERLSVPVLDAFPGFGTELRIASGAARGVDARVAVREYPLSLHWTVRGYATYSLATVTYETTDGAYHPPHDRRHQGNVVLQFARDEYAVTVQTQYGTGLPFNESAGFDRYILLTHDVDVTTEPGVSRIAYGEPFGGRLPEYARTDLWLERAIERRRSRLTIRAGALNVFNRANLFYFDLYTYRRVDQLPFIPSVGVRMEYW